MQEEQLVSLYKRQLTDEEKLLSKSMAFDFISKTGVSKRGQGMFICGFDMGYRAALSSLPPAEETAAKDAAIKKLRQALEQIVKYKNVVEVEIATAALEETKHYQQ